MLHGGGIWHWILAQNLHDLSFTICNHQSFRIHRCWNKKVGRTCNLLPDGASSLPMLRQTSRSTIAGTGSFGLQKACSYSSDFRPLKLVGEEDVLKSFLSPNFHFFPKHYVWSLWLINLLISIVADFIPSFWYHSWNFYPSSRFSSKDPSATLNLQEKYYTKRNKIERKNRLSGLLQEAILIHVLLHIFIWRRCWTI